MKEKIREIITEAVDKIVEIVTIDDANYYRWRDVSELPEEFAVENGAVSPLLLYKTDQGDYGVTFCLNGKWVKKGDAKVVQWKYIDDQ